MKREEMVVVYTHGSCLDNRTQTPRAGVGVFWEHGHSKNVCQPLLHLPQTNNNAAIAAVTTALRQARRMGYRSVEVRTNSQFAINALTSFLPIWKNNGMRRANGKPVKNAKAVLLAEKAMDGLHVVFTKVSRNEMAHALVLSFNGAIYNHI